MSAVMAYYGLRRGGSGSRPVRNAAEAEKILRGGYHVTTVRMLDETGYLVGVRYKQDDGKWFWCFEPDAFAECHAKGASEG